MENCLWACSGGTAMTITKEDIEPFLRDKNFSKARRLLQGYLGTPGLEPKQMTWARQKLALSTYKDNELQSETALERALNVLRGEGLQTSTDPETLSLAGAIQKRFWETSGDLSALARSLSYYSRAFKAAKSANQLDAWTYAAINAAFVQDLLAREESRDEHLAAEDMPQKRRDEANRYRQEICGEHEQIVAVKDWWLRASLIEAYFGLRQYDKAQELLSTSIPLFTPDDWKRESMARQLAALARLHDESSQLDAAYRALSPLIAGEAAKALLIGKVGLALSGGGFRAALFHVGVLARLAELGVLQHVEVLSCVSGGSILGALYYLELRRRLQSSPEEEMTRDAYVKIVTDVHDKLLRTLQRDIRTRAMLKSLPSLTSRRTILTGKMIDEALYADGNASGLRLCDITVTPHGTNGAFHPRLHNWRRQAKVPVLILNATALNTGHNWQFTASYMGEAPTSIEPVVDATERLRRMYHNEAPAPHGEAELHTAVMASAAVPGIFRPIKLKTLYPKRVVRLSDGGVHDNQGIFGLLEQDCNVIIVSDGCGQLTADAKASWFFTRVLKRANDILMDTVRRNAYRILAMRVRSRRIRELHFIHLKRGLPTDDVTWIRGRPAEARAVPTESELSGLDAQTQRALAAIRTDLDCFSQNECHSLMFAGYRIADRDFAESKIFGANSRDVAARVDWPFLRVAKWMDENTASTAPAGYVEELECGRNLFFRRIRLSPLGRAWKRLRS
jgi:predicted acylesterase/phospholipase RssA